MLHGGQGREWREKGRRAEERRGRQIGGTHGVGAEDETGDVGDEARSGLEAGYSSSTLSL